MSTYTRPGKPRDGAKLHTSAGLTRRASFAISDSLVFINLLRGLWEMLPTTLAEKIRSRAVTKYLAAAVRHAGELLSRRVPMALEFMASTEGEISWPVVPITIRDAGVRKRGVV